MGQGVAPCSFILGAASRRTGPWCASSGRPVHQGSRPGIPATSALAVGLEQRAGVHAHRAGLDAASFRLPHGGAARGVGGLSSRGISMVGVLPAVGARAGPLAPASQWPAPTPPARSLRGARRKWPRDPRGLGPEVSGVWSRGRGAGRRGGSFGGGRAAGTAAAPESGPPRAAASAPGRARAGKRRWRPGDGEGGGPRRAGGAAGGGSGGGGRAGAARPAGSAAAPRVGAGLGLGPEGVYSVVWSQLGRTQRTKQDAALGSKAAGTGGRAARGSENACPTSFGLVGLYVEMTTVSSDCNG